VPAGFFLPPLLFTGVRGQPNLPAMNTTTELPPPPRGKVITAFAAVYILWGSTYLAIRLGVATMPPFLMAGTRFLLAGSLMMGWLWFRGHRLPSLLQWKNAAITGTIMLLGGNGMVCWAEQTVNSSLAALIIAASPIWFAVFDSLRPGGSRPKTSTVLGLIVGFSGVVILVLGAPSHGAGPGSTSLAGVLALVVACAMWAGGSIYSKYYSVPVSPWMATGAQMLCGGVANSLVSVVRGDLATFHFAQVSASSFGAFIYLIIFGSIIGFGAYVWLLEHCAAAKVATYAYVNPVIATLLGGLVLHEPLTPIIGLAAVVILGGVLIVQWPRWEKAKTASSR